MLDWDNTRIVFTKRTLIEFLKYTGTTVDPNFTNISKLPRYAKFGKISVNTDQESSSATPSAADTTSGQEQDDQFKPTRRVRQAPGGPTSNLFGQEEEDDGALSSAPARSSAKAISGSSLPGASTGEPQDTGKGMAWDPAEASGEFKPTRKVRERPGGKDSFWDRPEDDAFKPTRKVRERPGGKDSIGGLFGDF